MPLTAIPPPGPDEYGEFHHGYIAAVAAEPDAIVVLERQRQSIERLRSLSEAQGAHRYAEGKWTIREMVGHLSDAERIMSYRLLRIARGDDTPLPGFDETAYGAQSNADGRTLVDLAEELASVRSATLTLVRSLDESFLARRGVVNTWSLSARALAFIIAGHFQHHVNVLRERYRVNV